MSHPSPTPLGPRSRWLPLLVVLLVLVASACAAGEEDAAVGAAPTEPQAAASQPEQRPSGPVVAVGESTLGEVLVDGDGMTLYGFTNDSDGMSNCAGDCASNWPPVTVEAGFAVGEGLEQSLFSTTEREDGTLQLVAGDWPLYRYAADSQPGDTSGQGVGGVWFAAGADGELIRDAGGGSPAGPGNDYDY